MVNYLQKIVGNMVEWSLRNAVAPIALLSVAALGYALVLAGGVPSGYEGTTVLAGLFGVVSLAAAGLREWVSAVAAIAVAVGYWFGSTAGLSTAGFYYILVIASLLAFFTSTIYSSVRQATRKTPA